MKAIEEWNPIKGYNSVINYFRSKDETPEDLKADIKGATAGSSHFQSIQRL